MKQPKHIYLIDPPTFPKGVMSLSFAAIAACIPPEYTVEFIDLNIEDLGAEQILHLKNKGCLFAGIKVSGQNHKYAIEITALLKSYDADMVVVWGGEFPSLMPEIAGRYADSVVSGAFESVAGELLTDLENGQVKKHYSKIRDYNCQAIKAPVHTIVRHEHRYMQTMGYPVETSRGCDKKCTFCMVHTMQPLNNFKAPGQLKEELDRLTGKYVNVVDYNIGADKRHLDNVTEAFRSSRVAGWMGEMCLETLDNDDLLERLAESRCRIIYCGLESVSEESLKSINKANTNNIANYTRIIKKAQSHGIQIAAGVIVGMSGATAKTIDDTFRFFQEMGIIYAKITFLTYNPGTKVFQSMKRVGEYLTGEPEHFDGQRFTFVPHGVDTMEVTKAMIGNIKSFYSLKSIRQRAARAGVKGYAYWEFILFNVGYRDAYRKWLEYDIFDDEQGMKRLTMKKFKKSLLVSTTDRAIKFIRTKRATFV